MLVEEFSKFNERVLANDETKRIIITNHIIFRLRRASGRAYEVWVEVRENGRPGVVQYRGEQ
jgi:hypothetical protein